MTLEKNLQEMKKLTLLTDDELLDLYERELETVQDDTCYWNEEDIPEEDKIFREVCVEIRRRGLDEH